MADARDELVRRQARRAGRLDLGPPAPARPAAARPSAATPCPRRCAGCSTAAATRSAAAARSSTRPRWDAAADGYDVTAAPSMRMVVSLADLDASRWVNLTGVSGHAFDPHYADQTDAVGRRADAAAGCPAARAVERRRRRDADAEPDREADGTSAPRAAG